MPRPLDELVLGQIDRDLHPVAHLAVHLHDELEGVPLEHGGIGLGQGADHRRSCPRRSQSSSVMCGANGWNRLHGGVRGEPSAGSSGFRASSLTSSMIAAIGVFRAKRRPMSSVTFAIVACALRASGVSGASSATGLSACSHERPELVEEPAHAARSRRPRKSPPSSNGPEEHQVGADGVGAPPVDVLVGHDHVALRLRHLRAVGHDQLPCARNTA